MTKTIIKILLIFYWIVVFIATSLPGQSSINIEGYDKFAHYGAYAVLAFLMYWFFYISDKNRVVSWRKVFIIGFVLSFYGVIDEIHQSFVPGRSTELLDWCADVAGIWSGILSARYLFFTGKNKEQN